MTLGKLPTRKASIRLVPDKNGNLHYSNEVAAAADREAGNNNR